MLNAVRLLPLDHRDAGIAAAIAALSRAAYAQEARLIGVDDFPPLRRTAADVQASDDRHVGAWCVNALAGAVVLRDEHDALDIVSLVVDPAWQRRGIGRLLLRHAIAAAGARAVTVSTAAANAPALALYRAEGFAESGREVAAGADRIAIVAFRRG